MTVVQALPSHGDVFFDVRDDGRSMRVGWHADAGVVVLSSWRYGSCVSTCQVDRRDVPALVAELVRGLAILPGNDWTDPIYVDFTHATKRPASASPRTRQHLGKAFRQMINRSRRSP